MKCPDCKGRIVVRQWPCKEEVCSSCGLVFNRKTMSKGDNFIQWNPEWPSNWRESDSESLKEWLTILRTVSSQLSLPSIPYKEEAARIIRKENHILSQSQKFVKNKRAAIAALLHIILKQYGKNRPIQEICKQLGLDSKLVIKQTWRINRTAINKNRKLLETPRKTATDYLFERGGKITSETKILIQAREILSKIRKKGGNPLGIAAGALYHICKNKKNKVSKEQIAEVFGISHRTVYSNEAQIRTALKQICVKKALSSSSIFLQAATKQQENCCAI